MSLLDFKYTEITDFKGPWLRREATDVSSVGSLLSLNMEYNQGQAATRKGFKEVWNPAEHFTAMYNWVKGPDSISAAGNYLVYWNGTAARIVSNLNTPVPSTLFSATGATATITSSGTRLYISPLSLTGAGVGQCRVCSINGAAFDVDKAFMGPPTTVPTLTTAAGGICTRGMHRVGYIVRSRSGFLGKIAPLNADGSFNQTSVVYADGAKVISFSLAFTPAADAATIYPVMATVSNPNKYYLVPGLKATLTPGVPQTVPFTINITDEDLRATATEVTENILLLTQDSGGNGPFNPFCVTNYGSRMVYMADVDGVSAAYFSDPIRPQHITTDKHAVYLPGQRKMVVGRSLRGTFYMFGPHWTYSVEDNADTPDTWAVPQIIDGSIGTMSPFGVAVNDTQGYMWVADQGGLYLFTGGAYPSKPCSYEVEPDWKRINWTTASTMIEVVDIKDRQQVFVMVPLDGAFQPTHIMMFDYSNGVEPDQIKYSLWSLDATGGFYPGSICAVRSPSTSRLELWVGSYDLGKVIRQMTDPSDTNPYWDYVGASPSSAYKIQWTFETALQPGQESDVLGMIYRHHAGQVRATGAGSPTITAYGLDRTKSAVWPTFALSANPGAMYTKFFPMSNGAALASEAASIRFQHNVTDPTAGSYIVLSAYRHFYKEWITRR